MHTDDVSARARLRAARAFLVAAAKQPAMVGAVLPSSFRLATVLASVVPTAGCPVVVELGPGTGAISGRIGDRLPAGARHVAIDLNPHMVSYLHRVHPELEVVHGDARHLGRILTERGIDKVDAVVSGLPWSIFPGRLQHEILAGVCGVLAPHGVFATFAYLHGLPLASARAFRARLGGMFSITRVSTPIWGNVPPAVVYECRGARAQA